VKIEYHKNLICVRYFGVPEKIDRRSALREYKEALLRFDRAIDRAIQFKRKVAGNIDSSHPLCSAQTRRTKLFALRALQTRQGDAGDDNDMINRAIGTDRDAGLLKSLGWATIPTEILGDSRNDIVYVTNLLDAASRPW
jgi:hypothetical protein